MRTLALLAAALLAGCAGWPAEDRATYGIARAGGMILEDETVEDYGIGRNVVTVNLEGMHRIGHFGFVSGLDGQFDRGKVGFEDFQVTAISVPLIAGVNTTPIADFNKAVPNAFLGAGAVLYAFHVGNPIDERDYGVGPVVDFQFQLPAPGGRVFLSLGARYSWRPLRNDDLEPIDNIGGLELTGGIGIRF